MGYTNRKPGSTSSCGCRSCLFNIQWKRISLVCSRPACILLACVGFGQETRANAPSPTSNRCQAPLNVTGWLESRGRGEGVGGGGQLWISQSSLCQKETSSHSRAYQRTLGPAPLRLLRRTRCSVSSSVPLCVWYGLGQRGVLLQEGGHCTAQTHCCLASCTSSPCQHLVDPCVQPSVQDWTGRLSLRLGHSGSSRLFLLLPAAVFMGFCLIFSVANSFP